VKLAPVGNALSAGQRAALASDANGTNPLKCGCPAVADAFGRLVPTLARSAAQNLPIDSQKRRSPIGLQ
jgi:hypothetical protein